MRIDLHTHSRYSYDAEDCTVEALCESAVAKGISILAVTDHKDFFYKKENDSLDAGQVYSAVCQCRERYGDKLELLWGVEAGQPFYDPAAAAAFFGAYDFDYVIGSLHAMPCDTDIYFLDYDKLDRRQFLSDYFDQVIRLIQFGGFQTLGHLDYPLRVMKREGDAPSFQAFRDRVDEVLTLLIQKDIALEINARTLFSWQKRPGPEPFILQRFQELSGRYITVGSDAHRAADVGSGIEEAIAYIKSFGIREITAFRHKIPYFIKV